MNCRHYDKKFNCCKILSDWSNPMPVLRHCIKGPCKYYEHTTHANVLLDIITTGLRCCSINRGEDCDNCPYLKCGTTTGCVNLLIEDTLSYLESHNIEQVFAEIDTYLKDFSTGDIDSKTLIKALDDMKEKWLK